MRTFEEISKSKRVFNIRALADMRLGMIKLTDAGTCTLVWGEDEDGWEHVSIAPKKQYKTPTWNDMCQLKDIFFREDEEVLQLHPKKDEYVSIKDNCLHLWKPKGIDIMDTMERAAKKGGAE